jgi:MFS family permease
VQVFKQSSDVARLMVVMGLMELPWTVAQPFMPVYAHDFKGANEFVLGGMAMTSTLVPMLASIPLGRLADRHALASSMAAEIRPQGQMGHGIGVKVEVLEDD